MNDYFTIDSGGYLYISSLRTLIAMCKDASWRSRDGVTH